MLIIAVTAVICGADGWAQLAAFGWAEQPRVATLVELPGGMHNHDSPSDVSSA